MFTIHTYNNPYLRVGQATLQAVLSISLDNDVMLEPAPLTLVIALDHSASMDGIKIRAARDGAIKVVQSLDASMNFMLVTFNDNARVIYGPAMGTDEHKRQAINALRTVHATNGTRMSTALNTVVDHFGKDQSRATKILFLTDGKNEGEYHHMLERAINRCKEANISINAWGVGTDWDAAELRHMADATHGSANISPTPQQIAAAFTTSFSEMRKTAITNAKLSLWMPTGVKIKGISQVFPSIVPLGLEPDPTNIRQQIVSLGSFAAGDQHDYLLDLETPIYPPGQQFMILRPGIRFFTGNGQEHEEKSARTSWLFVQWTENMSLAAQIEEHIAHYTHQEELSQAIKAGQDALAAGDNARATRLLGQALEISERTGNEKVTHLLSSIIQRDPHGTIQLNAQADAVARKTLAINVGRTTKLK